MAKKFFVKINGKWNSYHNSELARLDGKPIFSEVCVECGGPRVVCDCHLREFRARTWCQNCGTQSYEDQWFPSGREAREEARKRECVSCPPDLQGEEVESRFFGTSCQCGSGQPNTSCSATDDFCG
ncbi:hypothetical protein ACFL08_00295 [Patescibacteria group bacterium]